MTLRAVSLAAILTLCFVAAAPLRASEPPAPGVPEDYYRVLTERNIFLRDRYRPPEQRVTPPAPPRPERSMVLNGIARQNGSFLAFLEDIQTGMLMTARVDDEVAQGQIVEIALDYLVFEKDGQSVRVNVGRSLAGTPFADTASTSENTGTTAPTTPSAPALPGDAAAILERLRQQREQEINR